MPIEPLPVILEEEQAEPQTPDELKPPESVVVRYGHLRQIAELPYDLPEVPGCGTPLVIRSPRGIELARMLTVTCENGGCGHSVTRKQMLSYIDQSGGKQYPFITEGKVLRLATAEDIREQEHLDQGKPRYIQMCKQFISELDMPMKLVDVELLLGGDRVIFHFMAESRIDFRELVRKLASEFRTRIEMRQVGARDEARLTADYEKCGQHCCCRQFLKVLRPVSMRAAKIQKATLDPTKISGRCGRLMCCLRYEEKTYDQLRKNLPNRNDRVLTEDGPGSVLSTQILTQLVLVKLDYETQFASYPVENIEPLTPERDQQIKEEREAQLQAAQEQARAQRQSRSRKPSRPRRESAADQGPKADPTGSAGASDSSDTGQGPQDGAASDKGTGKGKRRRRRRKRRKPGGGN